MMPHKGAIASFNRVLPILAKELGVSPPPLLIEKQFTDWSIDFFSKRAALGFKKWWDAELGAYIFKSSDFVHPEVLIHETKPINHAPRLDLEKYKDIKPDIKLHPEKLISQETFSENHFLEWRLRRQTSVVNLSSTRQRI